MIPFSAVNLVALLRMENRLIVSDHCKTYNNVLWLITTYSKNTIIYRVYLLEILQFDWLVDCLLKLIGFSGF